MKEHSDILKEYNKFLADNSSSKEPLNLYEPISYLMGLGGKRMRPVAALLAYSSFRVIDEKALRLAHAVELFHNFTLMHDDIMDDAPLRRGKETVHEKWDTPTAILSGDMMLIHAYKDLSKAIDTRPSILSDFNKMAEEVCQGQQMDMDFESREEVKLEEYLRMIDLKTAVLLAFSLKAGALLGGAANQEADHYYAFGMKIGRGFQLMDDYLDAFGNSAKVGKQVGGDIIENKQTYLLIQSLNKADDIQLKELKTQLANPNKEEKVKKIKALMIELGVADEIKEEIKLAFQQGFDLLNRVPVDTSKIAAYIQLLEKREK